MIIIFHPNFFSSYDDTPAGESGRLEPTYSQLQKDSSLEFVEAKPCSIEALERAHSLGHIQQIQHHRYGGSQDLFDIAVLAAGGAIQCAEFAARGESAFALIRPPGHHASADSCWGFCYFNNLAISLLHLRATRGYKKAFILDFDLHTGDGTINILGSQKGYHICNPAGSTEALYLQNVQKTLDSTPDVDIITASAGFDQGIHDWGHLLTPEGYYQLGEIMKTWSIQHSHGRRYAVLEGGYNFTAMAECISAFCRGFR